MNVPYEVVSAPIYHTPASIRTGLREFATSDVPVITLRNLGSSLMTALQNLELLLPPEITPDRRSWGPSAVTHSFDDPVLPERSPVLHTDNMPPSEYADDIGITFHFTEHGITTGSFFRHTTKTIQTPIEGTNWERRPYAETTPFMQGFVDDSYLIPVCYRAVATPGTMIAFKDGEPLAHYFDNTQLPRLSYASLADLAISPSLSLRFGPEKL